MKHKYNDPMIGRRLRLARKNVGMLQETAAQEMGFVRTTLIAIEKGTRPIWDSELSDMASPYKVPEQWLIEGDRDEITLLINPEILKAIRQIDRARAEMDEASKAERMGLNALYDAVKKCLPSIVQEEDEE